MIPMSTQTKWEFMVLDLFWNNENECAVMKKLNFFHCLAAATQYTKQGTDGMSDVYTNINANLWIYDKLTIN